MAVISRCQYLAGIDMPGLRILWGYTLTSWLIANLLLLAAALKCRQPCELVSDLFWLQELTRLPSVLLISSTLDGILPFTSLRSFWTSYCCYQRPQSADISDTSRENVDSPAYLNREFYPTLVSNTVLLHPHPGFQLPRLVGTVWRMRECRS